MLILLACGLLVPVDWELKALIHRFMEEPDFTPGVHLTDNFKTLEEA